MLVPLRKATFMATITGDFGMVTTGKTRSVKVRAQPHDYYDLNSSFRAPCRAGPEKPYALERRHLLLVCLGDFDPVLDRKSVV